MNALSKPDRPYGEEHAGDVYDLACRDECRLGCGDQCIDRGWCRLEVTPDRKSRVTSAYYDNRHGVLVDMMRNGAITVVRTNASKGLPTNDPIAIAAWSLKDPMEPDDHLPHYDIRAEGLPVDGPLRITLLSLNARIEDLAPRRRKA